MRASSVVRCRGGPLIDGYAGESMCWLPRGMTPRGFASTFWSVVGHDAGDSTPLRSNRKQFMP